MDWVLLGNILGILMAVGVGLAFGSYATMPYYRLPNKIPCAGKWIGKKSACPKCGAQLRTRDLVPVFNWLLTHGKCKFCGSKISKVYFFIEFGTVVVSVLTYLKFGVNGLNFYMIVFGLGVCLIILTATDHTYKTLPDAVLVVAVMLGFLYHNPDDLYDMVMVIVYAVLISIIFAGIYKAIKKKPFPRFDYLRLIGVAGIWLTAPQFFSFLALAIPLIIITMILKKLSHDKIPLPYAAALALPFFLVLLYPSLVIFIK